LMLQHGGDSANGGVGALRADGSGTSSGGHAAFLARIRGCHVFVGEPEEQKK
jgi:hypothetical protein